MKAKEWHFDFCLCDDDNQEVDIEKASTLLNTIVDKAEEMGLLVGGGFSNVEEEIYNAESSDTEVE